MTYTTYTNAGPFNPGTSPGISAAFLNAVETMLHAGWFDSAITSNGSGIETALGFIANGAIQPNPTAVTQNGQTSGTASLYQIFTGTIKMAVGVLSNYQNTAAQEMLLPTAFTTTAMFFIGNAVGNSFSFRLATTDQSLRLVGTFGAAASTATTVPQNSMGTVNAGFDRVRIQLSTGATSCSLFVLGV